MDTNLSMNAIEFGLSELFGIRSNLIVPNVSWGFFASHEADLVVVNRSGYLTEVEIKRSWQDFLNDFRKQTTHDEGKVMWKYFAVPESILLKVKVYLEDNGHNDWGIIKYSESGFCQYVRYPNNIHQTTKQKKLFLEEQLAIARLGTLRIWSLKKKCVDAGL